MCLMKITCQLNDGIAPLPFAPTFHAAWLDNLAKYSEPYLYDNFAPQEDVFDTPYQEKINSNSILLFDSEKELNIWANNCRLTDPQLIADQETWKTAHGITFTYEYYLLSPTTGPSPIV